MSNSNMIYSILRVLTPEEIHQLTVISSSEKKATLTSMLEGRIPQKTVLTLIKSPPSLESVEALPAQAEVPLVTNEIAQKKEEKIRAESKEHKRESKMIMQGSNALFVDAEPEVVEEQIDTTTFILEEKKRSEQSQKKLKTKEILRLYQEESTIDLNQERLLNQDLSQSSGNGLLVNKKQA